MSTPVIVGWTMAAFPIALVGVAGSLWLSIGMGLKACPLCLYERTFMMALAGALFFGLLRWMSVGSAGLAASGPIRPSAKIA